MEIKNRLFQNLQNLETKVESILNKQNLTLDPKYSDLNKIRGELSKKYFQTNPEHVVKSQITDEFYEQKGIKYLIKFLKIDKKRNKIFNQVFKNRQNKK